MQRILRSGYCFYNNITDLEFRKKWGALYNWMAVSSGHFAPETWRVPSDADWTELEDFLIANGYNWDGSTTGNKVAKAMAANTDWMFSPTEGAIGDYLSENNATGFSALPGGKRFADDGVFEEELGYFGNWWTSSFDTATGDAFARGLSSQHELLARYSHKKTCGYSVRLVRDLN